MSEKKGEVIDLDSVMLSQEAVTAWLAMAGSVARAFAALGITDSSKIPAEQGRINENGSLTIFVELPNDKGEVSMEVPQGNWHRRQ